MTLRTCNQAGKLCYRDKVAALMAVAKINHRGNRDRSPIRAYYHAACHSWHLTSTSKRKGVRK